MKDTPPENNNDDQKDDQKPEDLDADTSQETASMPEKTLDQMTEEELLNKVLEYRALSQRLAADYQNLQKETEQRLFNGRKYAVEGLILQIAPLVDYFDSAFAAVSKEEMDSSWMQGIKHIQSHLLTVLKDNNVALVETVGKKFDPECHETVSEEDSDKKPHTIIKQIQAGFTLNGKVIKPAKVVVAAEKTKKN